MWRAWLIGKKLSSGQSVIEVIVALGIFAASLAAAFSLFFGGQSLTIDTVNSQLASNYAKEGMEASRAIRDKGWSNLAAGNHGLVYSSGNWQFSGTSDQGPPFTRVATVADIDANTKEVKIKITWQTDPLRTQEVELVEQFTNWQDVISTGGDTGGTPPTGNWCNPRTLGSVDLGPGNSATDLDVINKIVYITSVASAVAKPDFFIVNATNGDSPTITSTLDVGSKGLNGVDVANNYAYVVGPADNGEFMVIDVNNINSPVKVATLNLSGNADGFSVFYYNNYAYVGRASGAAQEFVIINVADPLNPTVTSELSGVGDEINRIFVLGTRAYLATEDNARGMIIVDVSNPSSPSILGSMNSGAHVYSIHSQDVSKLGVGGKTKFFMVDASNPGSITTLGSVTLGDRVRALRVLGGYAYMGTEDSNAEYQSWNVANPSNITLCATFNFPQVATGIDYESNLVYMAVRSNDALRIITSQ